MGIHEDAMARQKGADEELICFGKLGVSGEEMREVGEENLDFIIFDNVQRKEQDSNYCIAQGYNVFSISHVSTNNFCYS